MINTLVTAVYFAYLYYTLHQDQAPHWAVTLFLAATWIAIDVARMRDKE